MTTVTLAGQPVQLNGALPAVGAAAPAFTLTAADLSDKTLADFAGKRKVLNIFPSIDTGVCQQSVLCPSAFLRRGRLGQRGNAV